MPNERLRALLLERGQTPDKLAEAVSVDPKTVERWVTKGRTPYRAHRYAVAAFLGVDESYIWPDALGRDQVTDPRGRASGRCPAFWSSWRSAS
jgi:transcriptional regulator with XRE-family HTH domain